MTDPTAGPGQIASTRVYSGRVVQLDVDTVRFPDGSTGEIEMFRHSGAAAVIPVVSDPTGPDPQILLIRQYRYAADGPIWEVPAGRLDKGEEPLACARRELLEETGSTAGRIEPLTMIYPTPGFCDERIHLFAAFDLTVDDSRAQREPDEFLTVSTMALSSALGMIKDGTIADAKTICSVLFYAGFCLGL
ncbi:MAG TPA: NUDIX hydrolase [Gemmatimonadales bacterium]